MLVVRPADLGQVYNVDHLFWCSWFTQRGDGRPVQLTQALDVSFYVKASPMYSQGSRAQAITEGLLRVRSFPHTPSHI